MTLNEKAASLSQKQIVGLLEENQRLVHVQEEHDQEKVVFLQEKKALEERLREVEHQLEWFKRQLFGRKSEKRIVEETDQQQLFLGKFLDVDETPPPPTETIKSYQRRQRRKQPLPGSVLDQGLRFDETVPMEVVEIPPPEIEGLDPSQVEMVTEKVTYRLAQRPGSYVIVKYVRKVAKLKATQKLVCAPAPSSVFEKSYADVSFLAGLLIDKFCYHLPLYRQHQRLKDSGIVLSRTTLTNLVHRTVDLLEPIHYANLSSILQSQILAMDETPIRATRIKEKKRMKTAYFWPVYGERDEVAFLFSLSRASPVVKEVLGSFGGVLLSDGYKVYDAYVKAVERIDHAQCWTHTRRKFVEAEHAEASLCRTALEILGRLYEVEEEIRKQNLRGNAKLHYRIKYSTPVVDRFFTWLKNTAREHILLPSNPFTQAANYAVKREASLRVFLQNPDVQIDTTHVEREIRPLAVGRKNWLFCWTEIGAHYVGVINSLLATCRLHGVDPYTYLVDVLQRIDTHPAMEVHRLTPRLWKKEFAHNPMRSDIDSRKYQ